MSTAVISFARKDSTRFPKKNMEKLNGFPLIWYTIETMKYIQLNLNLDCYILTDWHELETISTVNNIKTIWRDHPKEWDDIRLNKWAHEKIGADNYVLLQPTNPLRNNKKICDWIMQSWMCDTLSSFSAYRKNRKEYEMNGAFFYYHKDMLDGSDLVDEESVMFIDTQNIDIDTKEDFEKAEGIMRSINGN